MRITIYRGTHEIGGTLLELKTDSSRILLDAGYPLFLNNLPIEREVADYPVEKLLELGVLPDIKGLYSWDEPGFDAVVISHAHIDHYGLLKYVHPSIPICMSAGTRKLIEISQLFDIVDKYELNTVEFRMYDQFTVGDFVIKPYLMDHSAFDAAAFEITAEGKTIIYSGDFRGHGRKAVCLDSFIKGVKKECDVLFIEGTMFGRQEEEVLTEEGLMEKVVGVSRNVEGPVLFQSSSQNIDRIVSFYKASLKLKKLFVIDVYTANVLNELRKLNNKLPYPSPLYDNMRVFFPSRLTTRMFDKGEGRYMYQFKKYKISQKELNERQKDIVMGVRASMTRYLSKCGFEYGLFIYSLWQGYRESDYQQAFEKSLQKLKFESMHIHTSGHATVDDIKRTVSGLKPEKVIPIHTLEPDAFNGVIDTVQLKNDGEEFDV